MKVIINIARIIVGGLFIFSGLVKAIDPLGLSYKMQEFFEVWATDNHLPSLMNWLNVHSYLFSVIMITLEVAVGVALLIGWKKKLTLSILLLLILFFTFLTSYVLFSGKIRACGCFGDCIPLTPIQTFSKDIFLLILVILLLVKQKYVNPIVNGTASFIIVLIATIATILLQIHVVKHLPLKDCLPYKVGNDILELRKIPKDATYDKFAYTYYYKKGNEIRDYEYDKQPDSTWIYDSTRLPNKKLLEKGNGKEALIKDFSLTDSSNVDVTETVLGQKGTYYLLFMKDMDFNISNADAVKFIIQARQENIPLYIVTSQADKLKEYFDNIRELTNIPLSILSADGTAIKTAARANPTLFVMNGSVVQNKLSWADLDKILKK